MTNKSILEIVQLQLSYDLGFLTNVFDQKEPMVTSNELIDLQRYFLKSPRLLHMVTFGTNTCAHANGKLESYFIEFLKSMPSFRMYDSIQMDIINIKLKPLNERLAMLGEYYLPNLNNLPTFQTEFEYMILKEKEIQSLYHDKRFSMALGYFKKDQIRQDKIAVVAYDKESMIGIAACSNDSDEMYQIGIDVIDGYRTKGIAKFLVSTLTKEILNINKIPYLGVSIGNIASKRLARSCGYIPVWMELQSKNIEESNKDINPKLL